MKESWHGVVHSFPFSASVAEVLQNLHNNLAIKQSRALPHVAVILLSNRLARCFQIVGNMDEILRVPAHAGLWLFHGQHACAVRWKRASLQQKNKMHHREIVLLFYMPAPWDTKSIDEPGGRANLSLCPGFSKGLRLTKLQSNCLDTAVLMICPPRVCAYFSPNMSLGTRRPTRSMSPISWSVYWSDAAQCLVVDEGFLYLGQEGIFQPPFFLCFVWSCCIFPQSCVDSPAEVLVLSYLIQLWIYKTLSFCHIGFLSI